MFNSTDASFSPESGGQQNFLNIIGECFLGGKAQGLSDMHKMLSSGFNQDAFPGVEVGIPNMTVICTDVFEAFMERNDLYKVAYADLPDDRIAHAFQQADLPFEILGQLRTLIENTHSPLAVRSSSKLEDATYEPFAGVYATKMTPNNQFDPDMRFRKLMEAVKFVYASTYFQAAKGYLKATHHRPEDEQMAVLIQDVVGKRHGERYYPELSGVVRSYNFYPMGRAKNEDGIVNLALGLGKTVVDGDISWAYAPSYPQVSPPYRSIGDLLKNSQNRFWAINMGEPPEYDPINEIEYLTSENLMAAEADGTLRYVASTFDMGSGRLSMGVGNSGPRVLTFAPLLALKDPPLNNLLKALLALCEKEMRTPVEIEFAMTFNPHRFGFLQVRPMVVSSVNVDINAAELAGENVLAASKTVLGNGVFDDIADIVYVKPDGFEMKHTRLIAGELEQINRSLSKNERPYLLIVFGRLGTFDPWLGIPVDWGQISGAKAIVEATQQNARVELSQGSHFFHNLTSLGVSYFSVAHLGEYPIDWEWLNSLDAVEETGLVRHVRTPQPLLIKIDGRKGLGVIHKPAAG